MVADVALDGPPTCRRRRSMHALRGSACEENLVLELYAYP